MEMVSGFEPLAIFEKSSILDVWVSSKYACKDLILITGLIMLRNKMKNVGNKATLKILANDKWPECGISH